MSFFDEDPFEEILRDFFGETKSRTNSAGSRRIVKSEKEERIIDYIEEEEFVYFIFEVMGYEEKDLNIEIKGRELEISLMKENVENVQPYLINKLKKGIYFRKNLPDKVRTKKMSYKLKNGLLEVKFEKK